MNNNNKNINDNKSHLNNTNKTDNKATNKTDSHNNKSRQTQRTVTKPPPTEPTTIKTTPPPTKPTGNKRFDAGRNGRERVKKPNTIAG